MKNVTGIVAAFCIVNSVGIFDTHQPEMTTFVANKALAITMTSSPTLTCATASPTRVTTPVASDPICGPGPGRDPEATYMSYPK